MSSGSFKRSMWRRRIRRTWSMERSKGCWRPLTLILPSCLPVSIRRCRKRPRGTKVTITIMREGLSKPREFTLTRDVIPIRSVRYELMEKQYGYIRLSQFQAKTEGEFDKRIKALESER